MFLTYLLRVGRLEGWSIVGEHQTRNLRLLLCIVKILRRVYRVVLGIDILEGYRRWIDSCVASGTEGSGLSRHSVDKDVQWCCGVCTDVFFSFQGTPPPFQDLKNMGYLHAHGLQWVCFNSLSRPLQASFAYKLHHIWRRCLFLPASLARWLDWMQIVQVLAVYNTWSWRCHVKRMSW